jgi:hypothetical protein
MISFLNTIFVLYPGNNKNYLSNDAFRLIKTVKLNKLLPYPLSKIQFVTRLAFAKINFYVILLEKKITFL